MQFRITGILSLITFLATLTFSPDLFSRTSPRMGLKSALAQLTDAQRDALQQSIKLSEDDLPRIRKEGNRQLEANILNSLGTTYQYLGDFQKSIERLQEALAIAREIKDRSIEQAALMSLATSYSKRGDNLGIDFLEQQLQFVKQSGDKDSQRLVLSNLGRAYLMARNYQKVIDTYEQYLPMVREVNDRVEEVNALSSMSLVYISAKNAEKAITFLQQARAIAQTLEDNNIKSNLLFLLSVAYQLLGDDQKSLELSQQLVQLVDTTQNSAYQGLAQEQLVRNYAAADNTEKVIELLQEGLAKAQKGNTTIDKVQQGRFLDYFSRTYAYLGNYAKAIELQKQSLAIYQEIAVPTLEASALTYLGSFLWNSGQLQEAETALRSALKINKSLRELGKSAENVVAYSSDELNRATREVSSDIYQLLQQVLVAQNRPEEALEVAEEGRARAFVDLLATNLAADPKSMPTIVPPNLEQIKKIAKDHNSTLVEYSVLYDDLIKSSRSELRFGKKQPKETNLFIWVVKPTGEIAFRSVDLRPLWQQQEQTNASTALAEFVRNARKSIGARGRGAGRSGENNNKPLQKLYQVLIEPIADLLPTDPGERVTFIPQSYLYMVPFVAISDPTGKYLIEKHTILTAPSIQVLDLTHQLRSRPAFGKDVLVVGNPTMPSFRSELGDPLAQLSSLPASEEEAKVIAQLLGTQPLIGSAATEAVVMQQLPKARIIHLATHGILDNIQGLQSAIALAPSGNDDGFLSMGEVLNLKLNAELVVLSACNTGRGEITGDGVVGISRSFIGAGVPSAIVSLWSVPDAPTASLMTEFYQQLQQKPDKAQALRYAMLATMKDHPSPLEWGAFTLIGEAE